MRLTALALALGLTVHAAALAADPKQAEAAKPALSQATLAKPAPASPSQAR